jgi:exo-beta-1,3-glucanase (GH17 family)
MSFRADHYLKFVPSGQELDILPNDLSLEDLKSLFLEILNSGVHGFCFSLYEEGQKPGDPVSDEQIRSRMEVLAPHSKWIRTFSCTEGNERIPAIAREFGMNTLVGAWLGSDLEKNRLELDGLYALADQGLVDLAAVGNEVLYRDDLHEEQLLGYLAEAKERIPHIPVGYVDAYYEFVQRPALTEACDVIFSNCYPFWEGTHFDQSLGHLNAMYHQAKAAASGKKVIVSETGWPGQGQSLGGALPGSQNAMKYFINACLWAMNNDVELFYFSSFDEDWKVSSEGDVGAHWGIWDGKHNLKYV